MVGGEVMRNQFKVFTVSRGQFILPLEEGNKRCHFVSASANSLFTVMATFGVVTATELTKIERNLLPWRPY